ncbi:MAG: hydrogenase 3 maturation endopeptidase HyCI [Euryarchaeota archaeon]|nr:hydrogenase 3 maturation endopeptidase HyCI [Euryarchaeota archaeon]
MKKVLLAIGNELKGDDSAGMLVGRLVRSMCGSSWKVYLAGTTPESYVFKIAKEKPDVLLIVDATIMGKPPGEYFLIPLEKVSEEIMLSTHRIPTKLIINILTESCKEIYFVGVQPKTLEFGPPSKEVVNACKRLARIICEDKYLEIKYI